MIDLDQYPLIIGSFASAYHNCLPTWRLNDYDDVDIITTRAKAIEMCDLYGKPFYEHSPGRCMISSYKRLDLSFDYDPAFIEVLQACCGEIDPVSINLNQMDQTFYIAPMNVVLDARLYTAGFQPNAYEKSFKDLLFYQSLNIELSSNDNELALAFREIGLEAVGNRIKLLYDKLN